MRTTQRYVLFFAVMLFALGASRSSADGSAVTPVGAQAKQRATALDTFVDLDGATMTKLLRQGSLLIVRQKPDLSLINVTAGQLVNAPLEQVWATVADFEAYQRFMPQNAGNKVLERAAGRARIEQQIAIKFWHLPSVDITQQLGFALDHPRKMRFWYEGGELPGTYGGWDFVAAGERTMAFYTIYSPLSLLGWGLGRVFRDNPDYLAGVNVTTAMMVAKAVKEEAERRARRR